MLNDHKPSRLIDIHCHIVPGVDDGPFCIQDAIHMAKHAARNGVTTLVATPHHDDGRFINKANDVISGVTQLNGQFRQLNIPVTILPGQEIRVTRHLLEDLDTGDLLTLNYTSYLLLELPYDSIPEDFESILSALSFRNITPIIAHPERNAALMRQTGKLLGYLEQGALLQITAQSLTGLFGQKIQKFALSICKENKAHFIASDAHNMTTRSGNLWGGYEYVREQLGQAFMQYYQYNALCLIHDETIHSLHSRPARKWFSEPRSFSTEFDIK